MTKFFWSFAKEEDHGRKRKERVQDLALLREAERKLFEKVTIK